MLCSALIGALAILSLANNLPSDIQSNSNFVHNEYFIPVSIRGRSHLAKDAFEAKKYKNGLINLWNNEIGSYLYLMRWESNEGTERQIHYFCVIPANKIIFEKQFLVSQYLVLPQREKRMFQLTFVTKLTARLKSQITLLIKISNKEIARVVFNSQSKVNEIISHRFNSFCLNQGVNTLKIRLIRPKKQKRTSAFIGFSKVELRYQSNTKLNADVKDKPEWEIRCDIQNTLL